MTIRLFARLQESAPADGADAGAVQEPVVAKIEAPKVDPGVQKRIDTMTYRFREQERRAIAAEKELETLKAANKPKEVVAEVDKRKTLADFDFDDVKYEDYLAERVEARASDKAAKEAVKAVEAREQTKAQETTKAERAAKWKTAAETFAKDHPDFVERVYGEDLPFTDAVAELVADSDIGPQLAYHLAQNLDELARISKLSPAAAGREIGKLEVKLASESSREPPPKEDGTLEEEPAEKTASAQEPPATTKAPPPPPKLQIAASGSTRPATTDPKSDKLSDDEWYKAENKRLAALRKK